HHWVRRPEAGVSTRALTRRRVRKYSRRAASFVRALATVPFVHLTGALLRRGDLLSPAGTAPKVLVIAVYREYNARHIAALVDEARTRAWTARLWALDHISPGLASCTLGVSSGAKFPLLNELLKGQDLEQW